MIPRLVVASKNPDKVSEIEEVLTATGLVDEIVGGLEWPDVEETGESLEANALLKARFVMETVGLPAVADDTGLEVRALGGAPGVNTARYAGPDATYAENVDLLLRELTGKDDRSARFVTVIALAMPDGVELAVEGALEGVIAREPRGRGGFGYDPVFEVEGLTLSEMGVGMKNKLSHRARAIRSLAAALGAEV
ncbi:MAG TPA: RdgB/HAM1 family non-canonical purine NTP pyrophosphatase [Acidimicrobiia bacterium]|nr:RdgB/HAM1 family non-canonical purine NTP pyrophosphatase [Acidimicrobiia bacterium]